MAANSSSRMMLGSRLLVPLLCVAVVVILNVHHVEAQDATGEFSCSSAFLATCMINANCSDVAFLGVHLCVCNPGYEYENTSCVDIDECAEGLADCGPNASCNNTEDGYDCMCDPEYTLFGNYCVAVGNCSGVSCSDYASCDNETCICDDGFEGDGVNCSDIDECLSTNCTENATCYNSVGDYQCVCDPGFTGNGSICLAMCPADNCADNALCYIDYDGSELCLCNDGYTGNGFYICTDINECDGYAAGCDPYHATCNNTDGGYNCTCLPGYYGNGTDCTDIDECENPYRCDDNEDCVNFNGTHRCFCSHGYVSTDSGCRKSLLPVLIAVDVLLCVFILCVIVACCCCNPCCAQLCCCTMECKRGSKQPKWSKKYMKQANPPMQAMPRAQYPAQPQYAPRYAPQAQQAPQAQFSPQAQYALQPQANAWTKPLRMNTNPGQAPTWGL